MFRKEFPLLIFAFLASTAVWSDDAVSPRNSEKQRATSERLRESFGFSKYQVKTSNALSLDELQELADRLKSSSEFEDAELLQQIILEHQKLTKATAREISSSPSRIDLELKLVEVDFRELSADSPLHNPHLTTDSQEARKELEQLVSSKSAKVQMDTVRNIRVNEPATNPQDEVPPISLSGGKAMVTAEIEETGPSINDLDIGFLFRPTQASTKGTRLQMSCEISPKNTEHAATGGTLFAPGNPKRKVQVTFESSFGKWSVPMQLRGDKGHALYVMTRIAPSK